jgi:hypothetical protein
MRPGDMLFIPKGIGHRSTLCEESSGENVLIELKLADDLAYVGVMNMLWLAVITVFIFVEKLLPAGRLSARFAGVGLLGFGLWQLAFDFPI